MKKIETKEKEEIKYYNKIIDNIEKYFTSDNYDTSDIDKGEDQIIQTEKMVVTLTSTQNQKSNNNTNKNMTSLDLGNCETELRNYYNISDNETLYIKKTDIKQDGMKIPKIEYDVYYKFSGSKLIKLNISICEKTKISLFIPISITDNLDKLNSSSGYFNDKCYKASSDSGTDILLDDRKKEFFEGNKTVCQEKCDFSHYNYTTQVANCSCQVQESSNYFDEMNINKNELYQSLGYINNKKEVSNIGITSCNVLSSNENIKSNVGFFLLLVILFIFIIIFIIFCTKGYNLLEEKWMKLFIKDFRMTKKIKKINSKIL